MDLTHNVYRRLSWGHMFAVVGTRRSSPLRLSCSAVDQDHGGELAEQHVRGA